MTVIRPIVALLLFLTGVSAQSFLDQTDNQHWTDVQLFFPVTKQIDFTLGGLSVSAAISVVQLTNESAQAFRSDLGNTSRFRRTISTSRCSLLPDGAFGRTGCQCRCRFDLRSAGSG